jgi:hypothetical protein
MDTGTLSSYDFTENAKDKSKMHRIINNVTRVHKAMASGRSGGYNIYGDP